jgi:hypothetical protein
MNFYKNAERGFQAIPEIERGLSGQSESAKSATALNYLLEVE